MSLGYSIDCEHETNVTPVSVEVNNHFPLEREELKKLLEIAAVEKDVRFFSDIQVRVVQGIPGLTCPLRWDMVTLRKDHLISEAFLSVTPDNVDEVADTIMELYVSEVTE